MAAQLTDAAVRPEEAVLALSAFVSDDATGTTGGAIALRQGPLARWAARFSTVVCMAPGRGRLRRGPA